MTSDEILKTLYVRLHNNVLRDEKKLYKDSVLITLIKTTSNNSSKLLNESSVKSSFAETNIYKDLEGKKLIRLADSSSDEYVMTARGIWQVEKKEKGLSENNLLEYIESLKNFTPTVSNKGVSDKDKIILLTLLGTRSFSQDSVMDLNKEAKKDYWWDIFNDACLFLQSHSFIKDATMVKNIKHGQLHPMLYVMYRANDLPKLSQHIFSLGKNNNQYYLNVFDDNGISKDKLKLVVKLIFAKIRDIDACVAITEFCSNIASEKSKYVKDNFDFVDAQTDALIQDAIQSFYKEV